VTCGAALRMLDAAASALLAARVKAKDDLALVDYLKPGGFWAIVDGSLPGTQTRANVAAELDRLSTLPCGEDGNYPDEAGLLRALARTQIEVAAVDEGLAFEYENKLKLAEDVATNAREVGTAVASAAAAVGVASILVPVGLALAVALVLWSSKR